MPFIFFSCLIALAKASNTMWNRSGESGHSFLFLILEEKLSAFTIEYDVHCGLVIRDFYYVEVHSFYT